MIKIIKSNFNKLIMDGLLNGCLKALNSYAYDLDKVEIISVPGAFELPAITKKFSEKEGIEVIITLGCIIKGETDHYEYISQAVSNGIMLVSIESKVPIVFGVITCQNSDLAKDRSGSNLEDNKGYEVAKVAIELIEIFKKNSL